MAKTKKIYINQDLCQCCNQEITDDGYCNWHGAPFSVRSTKEICIFCLNALKPINRPASNENNDLGIDFIGTFDNDIYSLSEMVNEGFNKKRCITAIKKTGHAVGLIPAVIKHKLKS